MRHLKRIEIRKENLQPVQAKIKYTFSGNLWKYTGQGSWHFVSLPQELAAEIRDILKSQEEGWGRLKVTAQIGSSSWKTAIWYDTKHQTYLLPIKTEIRKKERLNADKVIAVTIWI